jgi:hypothetical protein
MLHRFLLLPVSNVLTVTSYELFGDVMLTLMLIRKCAGARPFLSVTGIGICVLRDGVERCDSFQQQLNGGFGVFRDGVERCDGFEQQLYGGDWCLT